MLYYRRKILLAILEVFGGKLSAIQMQKYLFLVTRQQTIKTFEFVPYKYGCFSFQANQDMMTLGTYGYVSISDNNYILLEKAYHIISQLDLFDQQSIYGIYEQFGQMSQDELVAYTYTHYPYYAINSTIASRILNEEGLTKVDAQRRKKSCKQLYSIGYEGATLEQYINKLIIEDVRVLCDVRKNAYSQKYGFSKSQLQKACDGVGIKYIHLPALGIESDKRQSLNSQEDYDKLFDEYERTILPYAGEALAYVRGLIDCHDRVALTCFEKNPLQCHRTRVANALMKMANDEYTFKPISF